jgi:hypothetical protein
MRYETDVVVDIVGYRRYTLSPFATWDHKPGLMPLRTAEAGVDSPAGPAIPAQPFWQLLMVRHARRHGHNEQDEPSATMPLTYRAIAGHPRVLQLYSQRLRAAGVVTAQEVDDWQSAALDLCAVHALSTTSSCALPPTASGFIAVP